MLQASVAVYVTVVVCPAGKLEGASLVTETDPSQPSWAVAVGSVTLSDPEQFVSVTVIGVVFTVITGGVVSTVRMVCPQDAGFPQSSVACHVRVMVTVCPHPETVASDELTEADPHVSCAVALPRAATLVSAPQARPIAFAGHVIVGGVVSTVESD